MKGVRMDSDYKDDTLITRLQAGDEKAMDRLYELHFEKLCSFANSLTGNKNEAEDIAQGALIQFWQHRAGFNSLAEIKNFLIVHTRNQSNNYLKHTRVRKRNAPHILKAAKKTNPDPFKRLASAEILYHIHKSMQTLPPKQQAVVKALLIDELTTEEVALLLEMTPAAVASSNYRAMKQLRIDLKDFH